MRGPTLALVLAAVSAVAMGAPDHQHRRHPREQVPDLSRQCIDIHELAHGQVTCNDSGCRMRCMPGYTFIATEKRSDIRLKCDRSTGKLTFRGESWVPEMTLCSPMCSTTCLNGGTCSAPDKCSCRSVFTGDHCEEEPMLGDQPYQGYHPSGPLEPNQRRVECEHGTRMPDGSTSVTLTYRDNSWFYPDGRLLLGVDQVTCEKTPDARRPVITVRPVIPTPSPEFDTNVTPGIISSNKPRLEPFIAAKTHFVPKPKQSARGSPPGSLRIGVCSSPCRNGGQCVMTNTCSCPEGFWGTSCEETGCTYPRFKSELNASVGGTALQIEFECPAGHSTLVGRVKVMASCIHGVWRLPGGKLLTLDDVQCIQRS